MDKKLFELVENLNEDYENALNQCDKLSNIIKDNVQIETDARKEFQNNCKEFEKAYNYSKTYIVVGLEPYHTYCKTFEKAETLIFDKDYDNLANDKDILNSDIYGFYKEWSKIAKAPYPLILNEDKRYEVPDAAVNYATYLSNHLNEYSLKAAKEVGITVDKDIFYKSFELNNLYDVAHEINHLINTLTTMKTLLKTCDIEMPSYFERSLDVSYDNYKKIEIPISLFTSEQIHMANNKLSNYCNELSNAKKKCSELLNDTYSLSTEIAEYNKNSDIKFDEKDESELNPVLIDFEKQPLSQIKESLDNNKKCYEELKTAFENFKEEHELDADEIER